MGPLGRAAGYGTPVAKQMPADSVEVENGSDAARIGIEPGDIVISMGDEPTGNVAEFRDALKQQDLKSGIRMQVMRDGAKRFVYLPAQ